MNRFFYRHIEVDAITACHHWTGFIDKHGYGLVTSGGKSWLAHRLAWVVHCGPIPAGKWVLHRCDNPLCVNPDHLFLGTARDNAQDMWTKGRAAPRHGEFSGTAKLTDAQVLEIRASSDSHSKLAQRYGVHKSRISDIKTRRSWRHI